MKSERLKQFHFLKHDDLDWVIKEDAGPISKEFYRKNLCKFSDALEWVHALPYGRNSNRENYTLIFSENRGTCSTKHAALAALCKENHVDAELKMAICQLDTQLDSNVAPFLKVLDIDYFPEAHCYLKYGKQGVDVTFPDQKPVLKAKILVDYSISPHEIGIKKTMLHHEYIRQWIKENRIDEHFSFDQVWKWREEWIASLGS